jgi:hypothetical protein
MNCNLDKSDPVARDWHKSLNARSIRGVPGSVAGRSAPPAHGTRSGQRQLFVYVTWPTPRRDQPSPPAGVVTLRDLTARDRRRVEPADHDGPLCRRCRGPSSCTDIDAVSCPPAPAPRRGRRPHPVTAPRMVRRSLSIRRPELAPPRRGCILRAVATLLSLRTRHTALCYVPLNERASERNSTEPLLSAG